MASQKAAEEQLAVLVAEKRINEEAEKKVLEQRKVDMQAEAERVKSIEGRCLELQRMCDAMHDDRNRMSKELANGAAHMRSLEEQLNQMSIEKRQQDQTLLYIHAMTRGPAAAHHAQPPPMVAPPQPQPQPTSPAIVMPRTAHEPNVAPAASPHSYAGLPLERLASPPQPKTLYPTKADAEYVHYIPIWDTAAGEIKPTPMRMDNLSPPK